MNEIERKKGIVLYMSWRAVVIIVALISAGTILGVVAMMDFKTNNITNTDNTSSTVSVSVSTYKNTKTQNI